MRKLLHFNTSKDLKTKGGNVFRGEEDAPTRNVSASVGALRVDTVDVAWNA